MWIENGSMTGLLDNYGMTFDEIYLLDPSWDRNTVYMQLMLGNRQPNRSHDDLTKEKFTEKFWRWIQRERPKYLLMIQTIPHNRLNVCIVFYGTTLKAFGCEYIPVIKDSWSKNTENARLSRCLRIISFVTERPVEDILNDKEIFPKSTLTQFKKYIKTDWDKVIQDAKEKDFTTYEL